MRAEIVTTGTELLLGQIDDTNATYLAQQLRDLGIDVHFRTTVGDNEIRIARALSQALERAELVIMTGGLGPTVDDVSRDAVSRVSGRPLVLFPELLAQIEAFFSSVGSTMSENNRRQACLPEGCLPVENPVGTAPAFIVEEEGGTIIALPGVPREMRYLMQHAVVPYLIGRLGQLQVLVTRILRTVAVGESQIDRLIADLETSSNPTVGLSAHPGQTDVRIVAKAGTRGEAEALIAPVEAEIRRRLGASIYATGDSTLESVVADLLVQRDATVAVVETVTRAEITRRMGAHPDAFRGGIVSVDGSSAAAILELNVESIAGRSRALALAERIRQRWDSHYGLAVLADAAEQPIAAISWDGGSDARYFRFRGDDARARAWTATLALEFMRRLLLGQADGWAG